MKTIKKAFLALLMSVMMIATGITVYAEPAPETAVVAAGETLEVGETTYFDALTIEEGATIVASNGALVMVADGIVVRPEAGEYTNVALVVEPIDYTFGSYDDTGNEEGLSRRFLYNNSVEEPIFVDEAFDDTITITEDNDCVVFDGAGSNVIVNDDGMHVITTEGGNMKIQNVNLEVNGVGICEINNIFGAAIGVVGNDSNVVVDNVNVKTVGAIMTAMNSGAGNVLVMNSTFNGYGTADDASGLHSGIPSYKSVQGSLTEVPWVLGLKGTLRTMNIIGDTNALYYNVKGTGNGWGVFSTDGGQTFIMINCDATYDDSLGAEFESLYGTYVLGLPTYLYGFNSDLAAGTGNTYGIVARHGFTLGASSQENLAALDELITVGAETIAKEAAEAPVEGGSEGDSAEGDSAEGGSDGDSAEESEEEANLITLPSGEVIGAEKLDIGAASGSWALFQDNVGAENVEARRSTLNAAYGVMSHGAKNDVFNITETDINASKAAFLMKQAYMTINMDGTVAINAPIIIHEQISDDAGISSYAYDGNWAAATSPFLYDVADQGSAPKKGVTANMEGMTLEGDFYNTDTDGAFLDLYFNGTETTSVISSARFLHNNASYFVVANPEYNPEADESEENMKYFCVDENGKAYNTTIYFSFFGGCSYQPEYIDEDGIVTFIYDEAGTEYAPEEIVGYAIFYNAAEYCSDGTITPAATLNNPVYVTLTAESVWNVTGDSYLAKLNIEEGCTINGVVTVDGETVDVTSGGLFEGNIIVTAE